MAQRAVSKWTRAVFRVGRMPGRCWYWLRRWPIIPAVVLCALIVAGVFAPLVAPRDPIKQNLRASNAPGTWDGRWYADHPEVSERYVLGTDHVGRDILSRVIHGARITLVVSSVALFTGLVVGTTLGLLAGYFGGHVDEIILRLVDVWFALPFILLAMVANIVFGPSFGLVIALLALTSWSSFVRNVRAEVLSLKARDYVAFARVAGASHARIILRHLLPGVANTVTVIASLLVGGLILAEASLSFLGIGIPSPTPAWGVMVAEGRRFVGTAWWMTVFPGLAIFLVVMSMNFIGDWLRDRLDPRLRQLA